MLVLELTEEERNMLVVVLKEMIKQADDTPLNARQHKEVEEIMIVYRNIQAKLVALKAKANG